MKTHLDRVRDGDTGQEIVFNVRTGEVVNSYNHLPVEYPSAVIQDDWLIAQLVFSIENIGALKVFVILCGNITKANLVEKAKNTCIQNGIAERTYERAISTLKHYQLIRTIGNTSDLQVLICPAYSFRGWKGEKERAVREWYRQG